MKDTGPSADDDPYRDVPDDIEYKTWWTQLVTDLKELGTNVRRKAGPPASWFLAGVVCIAFIAELVVGLGWVTSWILGTFDQLATEEGTFIRHVEYGGVGLLTAIVLTVGGLAISAILALGQWLIEDAF